LDESKTDGLLRFVVASTGETLTFALQDYQGWADDLAQAARRNLEAPVLQKQKDAEG
jgi:hypothetical protein